MTSGRKGGAEGCLLMLYYEQQFFCNSVIFVNIAITFFEEYSFQSIKECKCSFL